MRYEWTIYDIYKTRCCQNSAAAEQVVKLHSWRCSAFGEAQLIFQPLAWMCQPGIL